MLKKILFILLSGLIFPGSTCAQDFWVNNQLAERGATFNLFYDDLDAGKIELRVRDSELEKTEISLDKGRSWEGMEKDEDTFVFRYRPLSDETIIPELLLTYVDKSMATLRPQVSINYQKNQPDQAIEQLLEKLKDFYENENTEGFLNLFSFTYPNFTEFKEAVQNDFYNYKNIRLFYRIDSKNFDPDYAGAIWYVYWDKKYEDRSGNQFESTANMAMRLNKEGGGWLVSGLNNNTVFGSSLLASADLAISSSDISEGTLMVAYYTLNALIHNNGNATAQNFKVGFYYAAADLPDTYILDGEETVSNINANSQLTVAHNFGPGFFPAAGTIFKVVIDPDNVISEESEGNNEATKTYPF